MLWLIAVLLMALIWEPVRRFLELAFWVCGRVLLYGVPILIAFFILLAIFG